MRSIVRLDLPPATVRYLRRKQAEVDEGTPASVAWANARSAKTMRELKQTLQRMAGRRERCMFCEDSRGTDIEHFWPKSVYQERTFVWKNLLLACAGCNRSKGDRFELDGLGRPLLIDPTAEDPWDYLFYDPATGNITAKYDAAGVANPKGQYTSDGSGLPLNIEAVTEGRQRAQRALARAVREFLKGAGDAENTERLAADLLTELYDCDSYGLLEWFFRREGSTEPPFRDLKTRLPEVWKQIRAGIQSGLGATGDQPAARTKHGPA